MPRKAKPKYTEEDLQKFKSEFPQVDQLTGVDVSELDAKGVVSLLDQMDSLHSSINERSIQVDTKKSEIQNQLDGLIVELESEFGVSDIGELEKDLKKNMALLQKELDKVSEILSSETEEE